MDVRGFLIYFIVKWPPLIQQKQLKYLHPIVGRAVPANMVTLLIKFDILKMLLNRDYKNVPDRTKHCC